MIMAIEARPQFILYPCLQNENPLRSCKAVIFFYFVDDWDILLIFARAMTSYADELPTIFFVTQNMIRVIGNQIASVSFPLLEVSSGSEF